MFFYNILISPTEAAAVFSNKESVKKEVKATLTQKATLSCEVSDTKTEVKWYKDGKPLTSHKAIQKGKSRELVIEKIERKDAGEYTCEAGSEKLVFKLEVAGKKKCSSSIFFATNVMGAAWQMYDVSIDAAVKFQKKPVKDTFTALASESVVLTTEVNTESANVKWYRDGAEVKEGSKYEMKTDRFSRSLIIKSTDTKDSGTYTCQTTDDKLEFKVQVKGRSLKRSTVKIPVRII